VRYVTLLVRPERGFHPASESLAREGSVSRVAVHHVRPLADGSVVLLHEFRGDLDRVREVMVEHPDVLAFDIVGEGSGSAYLRGRPRPAVSAFLRVVDRLPVVLDLPIEVVDDGARFTFLGEATALRDLVTALPDEFRVEIERTGEYDPGPERLSDLLTERQHEVLCLAVEMGYYDRPRETTQEAVAEVLGITPETVNDHLRAVESRVFRRLC
jgi:DNA-binding CsgD family transcriptional regulator